MFTDEQKKIINAYINGKEIQVKRVGSKEWTTKKQGALKMFSFDFELFEYRFKPIKKYVVVAIRRYENGDVYGATWPYTDEHRAKTFAEEKSLDPLTAQCFVVSVECNQ